MRSTITLAAILLGAGIGLSACGSDRRADEKAIVDGERLWGGAYVSGDAKAVDRLLADDFAGVTDTGMVYGKSQALDDIRHGPQSTTSDTLGPVTVRFFGDAAVAQGTEFGTEGAPENKPFRRFWTSVWVKRDGRWQVVATQDGNPDAH